MDLKKTLNIFNSSFPMKANLLKKEKEILAWWDDINLVDAVWQKNAKKPHFILHDGPPYANGDLHLGHAFNKILKDMVVRYHNQNNFFAPLVCGWDTHGLPIEIAVSKQGHNRYNLSPIEFRNLCSQYADEQINNQINQFKYLGLLTNFHKKYMTKTWNYEMGELAIFKKMVQQKLIYRALKPIYWSPSSCSALAEAEIEYKNIKTPSIYVKFSLINNKQYQALDLPPQTSIIIWTTTPWTIPCNQLIAISPYIVYCLVKLEHEYVLVADDLLDSVARTLQWTNFRKIKSIPGSALLEMKYKHPLYEAESVIVQGFHVTTEVGTGFVHIASGFGEEDYEITKQNNLTVFAPLNDKGKFTQDINDPDLVDLFYLDANKVVINKLKNNNRLAYVSFITHSAPVDWRTGQPVIYRATRQWFVNIDKLKPELLKMINNVEWYPTWCKQNMLKMIEDRKDWCISRQRSWGIPIIAFYDAHGNLQMNPKLIDFVMQKFESLKSLESWFSGTADDFLPSEFQNLGWSKETDILDVWFDSGVSHTVVLPEYNLESPADIYFEGKDQFRGWFNSSLIISAINNKKPPYKKVVAHGFVNDGKGLKMSKSKNNVITINNFIKNNSVDLLRLWVASTDFTADVKFSQKIMQQISEEYRKIRNNIRFLINNLYDFDYVKNGCSKLQEVDYFIINRMHILQSETSAAFKELNFKKITSSVNHIITHYLSNFYLDFAKDILYITAPNNTRRRQIQTTLYIVLKTLLDVLKPILIFTTEEVQQVISTDKKSTHLQEPFVIPFHFQEKIDDDWQLLMELKKDVQLALETARNNKIVNKSLEAAVVITLKPNYAYLEKYHQEIIDCFILGNVKFLTSNSASQTEYQTSYIDVTKKPGTKCIRCWKIATDISDKNLCPDCCEIVKNYSLQSSESL